MKTSGHVQELLKKHPWHQVWLQWCPGHLNIELNERVDKAAKEGSKKLQPKYTSLAYARQIGSQESETAWRAQYMSDAKYTGHS